MYSLFAKKFHSKFRENWDNNLPNVKYSINGHMYGSLNPSRGLEFKYHSRLRWHVFSLNSSFVPLECDDKCQERQDEVAAFVGSEEGMGDLTINWAGPNALTAQTGTVGNSFRLGPTQSTSFDMLPTEAGEYRFWVSDYDKLGMFATFSVYDDGSYVAPQYVVSDEEGLSGAAIALISVGCIMLVAVLAVLVVVIRRPHLVGLSQAPYCISSSMDDSTTELNAGVPKSESYREYTSGHADSVHELVVCGWCGDKHINGAQNCTKMLAFLKSHPEVRKGVVTAPKNEVMI